jgi:hypothetical protein
MLVCELLSIRAMCAVLSLRDSRVFVIVMLALVVLSAALAAFDPLIRRLPASPHWAGMKL